MTNAMRDYWDAQADVFDEEPDHGLRDPSVRKAWADLLLPEMPSAPSRVLDVGCGTGSIALLLAQAGHDVHGCDLSQAMIDVALAKASAVGVAAEFSQDDAVRPTHAPASFDVVFARHVLWALPDPASGIATWTRLLRPHGRLVLVEGNWATGVGIPSDECRDLVLAHRHQATTRTLDDPTLWGGPITDDRYLLASPR